MSRVVINADNIQLLGGGTEQAAPAPSRQEAQQGFQDDFPEGIPF